WAMVLFKYAAAIAMASCSYRSPDDDDVRIERMNSVREFERRQAGGLRHRHVVAALDDVEERRRDREPARFDVVRHMLAVLVEQNRPAEHQLELDARVRVQLADQQLASPVIR